MSSWLPREPMPWEGCAARRSRQGRPGDERRAAYRSREDPDRDGGSGAERGARGRLDAPHAPGTGRGGRLCRRARRATVMLMVPRALGQLVCKDPLADLGGRSVVSGPRLMALGLGGRARLLDVWPGVADPWGLFQHMPDHVRDADEGSAPRGRAGQRGTVRTRLDDPAGHRCHADRGQRPDRASTISGSVRASLPPQRRAFGVLRKPSSLAKPALPNASRPRTGTPHASSSSRRCGGSRGAPAVSANSDVRQARWATRRLGARSGHGQPSGTGRPTACR